MRLLFASVLTLLLAFAASARACPPAAALAPGYAPACGVAASAQAQVYAPPAAVAAAPAPVYAAPMAAYVPQAQVQVIQRVVTPVYAAPAASAIVQHQVYVPQQSLFQANVGVGYGLGAGRALVVNRGLIGGAQRTVTKTRTVTRTGRPGLLNRILGR
jgi:hypothetical protein